MRFRIDRPAGRRTGHAGRVCSPRSRSGQADEGGDCGLSLPGLLATVLMNSPRPLVIGHRGYCALAPENTLPSFKAALTAGVDLVELDYYHTKDGVAIAQAQGLGVYHR